MTLFQIMQKYVSEMRKPLALPGHRRAHEWFWGAARGDDAAFMKLYLLAWGTVAPANHVQVDEINQARSFLTIAEPHYSLAESYACPKADEEWWCDCRKAPHGTQAASRLPALNPAVGLSGPTPIGSNPGIFFPRAE